MPSNLRKLLALTAVVAVLAAAGGYLFWFATNYTAGRVVAVEPTTHVVVFDMKAGDGVKGMLFSLLPSVFPASSADQMNYKEEVGEDYVAIYEPSDPAMKGIAAGDLVRVRLDPAVGHRVVAILQKAGK